jgi:CRISPR-associated protein Csb2
MTEMTLDVRSAAASGSVFSPNPLLLSLEREDGPCRRLDLLSVLQVTKRWRDALLTQSNGLSSRARELLSGHDRRGGALEGPHLAFLPLASVGPPHADGRLQGMALALPANLSLDIRSEILQAISAVHYLALGRLGRWKVTDYTSFATPELDPEGWIGHPHGARQWSTVTPVVFDRHPKRGRGSANRSEVAAMIRRACVRIGLPEPREVIATAVSAHFGVPPVFAFPMLVRKDGSERRHTHAILVFEEPVCGPVVIGAGRYRGYGFCRPMGKDDSGDAGRGIPVRERMKVTAR